MIMETRREHLALLLIVFGAMVLNGCVSANPERDARNKKQAAETNVRLASGYLEEGQYEIALEKAQSAVAQDPTNIQAQSVMAIIFEQLGRSDLAESHYRKAVEIDPDNGDVRNNFGTFLCQRGRYDAAQSHFSAAAEDPFYKTPEVALTNAGACARRQGDNAKAESLFREAIAQRPGYAEALIHLAEVSYETNQYFKARAFLQRYEAAGPAVPGSLLLGYRVETELADNKSAGQYKARLMKEFPNSREAKMVEESIPDDP